MEAVSVIPVYDEQLLCSELWPYHSTTSYYRKIESIT